MSDIIEGTFNLFLLLVVCLLIGILAPIGLVYYMLRKDKIV